MGDPAIGSVRSFSKTGASVEGTVFCIKRTTSDASLSLMRCDRSSSTRSWSLCALATSSAAGPATSAVIERVSRASSDLISIGE